MGSKVKSIGSYAFYECSSLASVTLPPSLTSVESMAFFGCNSLVSMKLPPSLTTIGHGAFFDCTSILTLKLPPSVTSIGINAFRHCLSLISVDLSSCSSITRIEKSTFGACRSLATIALPPSTTYIGRNAFRKCLSLLSVSMPPSVTTIDEGAFEGCPLLMSIVLPEALTDFEDDGDEAFKECDALMLEGDESVNIGWLQERFDNLPLHKTCYALDVSPSKLQLALEKFKNKKDDILATDRLGLTALDVLICNPVVTPDLLQLLIDSAPEIKFQETVHGMSPVDLFMASRGVLPPPVPQQQEGENNNNKGEENNGNEVSTMDRALEKGLAWSDIECIMTLGDENTTEQQNESKEVEYVMKAANYEQCELEVLYSLARRRSIELFL